MKKFLLGLVFVGVASGATPILFFTDWLDSPRVQGEVVSPGVGGGYACVFGKNFGPTRGSSTITIGGVAVGRYMTWDDPWPTLLQNKIARACFQVGGGVSVGVGQNLVLTTTAGASNVLPFTIRPDTVGRSNDQIYCLDQTNGLDTNDGHFPPSSPVSGQGCFQTDWRAAGYAGNPGLPNSSIVIVVNGTFTRSWDTLTIGTANAYAGWMVYPGAPVVFNPLTNDEIGLTVARNFPNLGYGNYFVFANIAGNVGLNSFASYQRWVGNSVTGNNAGNGSIHGLTNDKTTQFTTPVIQCCAVIYGNSFHDTQYTQGEGDITAIVSGQIQLTYSALNYGHNWYIPSIGGQGFALRPTNWDNPGTAPSCTGASPLCVSGHLFYGQPVDYYHVYSTVTYNTSNPQLMTIEDSATSTPITVTDIGIDGLGNPGGWNFAAPPDSLNHVLYIINSYDHVDIGWNLWKDNKVGKQIHVFNETGGCSPTCGWYNLFIPVTTSQVTQGEGVSPVVTEVAAGGSCTGHPCASARDYWINWSYETAYGETVPSHPVKFHVDANNLLRLSSPVHNNGNLVYTTYSQNIYTGSVGRFGASTYIFQVAQNLANVGTYGTNDCLASITVSGGVATVASKTNMTTAGGFLTTTCPMFTDNPPCYRQNECDTFANINPGAYVIGNPIAVMGNNLITGRYTVASVDPGGHQITFSCPGCPNGTYTDTTLELARFNDFGWDMYAIDNASGGGLDTQGWKQNSQPLLNGNSWTEPITGLVTGTSQALTRATQTGADSTMTSYQWITVHDNYILRGALWMFLHTDPFTTGNPVFNNVYVGQTNAQLSTLINVPDSINGAMSTGTQQFYNNTVYGAGTGIAYNDGQNTFPWSKVLYSNNILYLGPYAAANPSYYGYAQYTGSSLQYTTGTNNIWYGDSSSNSTVTGNSGLVNNTFADPGLVSVTTGDFHIASTGSVAYGAGTTVASGSDFDGLPRPTAGRFDNGIYQFNSGPFISPSSLPNGTVTQTYTQVLNENNLNCPTCTWSLTAGSLPSGTTGCTGTGTTNTITGVLTTPGTYTWTCQVTDGTLTASQPFSIVVAAAVSITTSSPLPAGTVGTAYSQTLAATGGTLPLAWTVTSGSLPTSLSLSSGGVISGTPTVGGVSTFTVHATDINSVFDSKTFSLTVNGGGTSSNLPSSKNRIGGGVRH